MLGFLYCKHMANLGIVEENIHRIYSRSEHFLIAGTTLTADVWERDCHWGNAQCMFYRYIGSGRLKSCELKKKNEEYTVALKPIYSKRLAIES